MRRGGRQGIGPFQAGVLAIVVIGLLAYFGFTKTNPFSNPYELKAVFANANNLKPNSPVRIAGVDVGKVKKVEAIGSKGTGDVAFAASPGEAGAARVTMELNDKALPLHKDATLKVRPRVFLEGNFFVDLKPGSPSQPTLDDGSTLPMQQTAAPVQFGQVLTALQSDTREDLQTFLKEFSKGLEGKGARGFNQSIKYWEPAYRNSALANDATLGEEPTEDLQRLLKGQARTFGALVKDENALKGLVTNLNVTAGALAGEDQALEASVPLLRDVLVRGQPTLRDLNAALPTVRAFAREALPGVRSSVPTLSAAIPFITQARKLVSRQELRGLAAQLRRHIPDLVKLNQQNVPILSEGRQLSRCTSRVLVPFAKSRFPNIAESHPDARNQRVLWQLQRGLVGLSGESRMSDGNGVSWFRSMAVPNASVTQPAAPPNATQPPPHRPDIPCETQEPPNLAAPVEGAQSAASGGGSVLPSPAQIARANRNVFRDQPQLQRTLRSFLKRERSR